MTRPGPKPGPPGSQRTARLVVRVTPAELSAYQAAAGRAGVSMGEWVRGRLAHDPDDIRARNAMAMLRRASKYVREDGAETPRSTRFAQLVTQIDDLLSRDLRSSQSADVCTFCGDERLPYQVGGLRNGHQDQTICPACGYDKTAAAEKEHGG